MTKNKAEKKKMNSYIKFIMWMAIGGAIGAVLSVVAFRVEGGVQAGVYNLRVWIGENMAYLMIALLLLSLVISIVCWNKGKALLTQYLNTQDDDQQDELDIRYDFWGNIGITGTSILLYIEFAIYAFGLDVIRNLEDGRMVQFLVGTAAFLLCGVICGFYQVAAVKQLRKKDPLKKGDAADLHFAKDWLASCDEVERRIIFESGYKAFSATRIILLLAVLVCVMGELYAGGYLPAIVMLTLCNVISTVIYAYHSNKLGKAGMCQ